MTLLSVAWGYTIAKPPCPMTKICDKIHARKNGTQAGLQGFDGFGHLFAIVRRCPGSG
ncbi:MAG: hypothetical protein FWD76_01510 [Firmicutes bacterium]|nr:hypothetical protein [Bacillota bacterium]